VTGILHEAKSEVELANAMLLLASDEKKRVRMGQAALERAVKIFPEDRVSKAMVRIYRETCPDARH